MNSNITYNDRFEYEVERAKKARNLKEFVPYLSLPIIKEWSKGFNREASNPTPQNPEQVIPDELLGESEGHAIYLHNAQHSPRVMIADAARLREFILSRAGTPEQNPQREAMELMSLDNLVKTANASMGAVASSIGNGGYLAKADPDKKNAPLLDQ